ncbi:14233_t:CDS:1, partial [Acaulospora morrowiae]
RSINNFLIHVMEVSAPPTVFLTLDFFTKKDIGKSGVFVVVFVMLWRFGAVV